MSSTNRLSRARSCWWRTPSGQCSYWGCCSFAAPRQIPILYALLAVEIATAAFFESGRNAALPSVVEHADIPTANALSSTTWATTVTIGAALGGVAVSFLGRDTAFLINSLTFRGLVRFRLANELSRDARGGPRQVTVRELLGIGPILEGFAYVMSNWRLALLLTLKFGLGILGARVVLVAVLGSRSLHSSASLPWA